VDASCIIVGDEILSGHVQDANGHFIASRLTATGHRLRRLAVVSDAPGDIVAAVRADVELGLHFVFVCGGLGPTHDDRTMEGVAEALGVALEPCEPIAERIRTVVQRVHAEGFRGDPLGVAGLEKMALAPSGAEFLRCESGVIPAVTLTHGGTRVFVLPGPPRELQMVFLESIEPAYLSSTGTAVSRVEIEHLFPESSLAAALTDIESTHPGVSLGSYPLHDRVLIRIAGPPEQAEAAAEGVRAAIAALESSEEGRKLLEYFRSRRMNAEH
jgi:molybdenum cofactor synthesis domain-containing protein